MFQFRHRTLIIFSGVIWFGIGLWLLSLGLRLIAGGLQDANAYLPLLSLITPYLGGAENGAIALIALGLVIGYFKGNKILIKSARRIIARVTSFPEPVPVAKVYSASYYMLIGSMMLIGMAIKLFQVPLDIRGLVDTAIGSALIHGSMHYFRGKV